MPSAPGALIILTWKRNSHPTSQGSLTPGEPDLVFLTRDPRHSTKDLTSPVTYLAETTDGNWNFTRAPTGPFYYNFFFLPSHKPPESQHLELGGKNVLG